MRTAAENEAHRAMLREIRAAEEAEYALLPPESDRFIVEQFNAASRYYGPGA